MQYADPVMDWNEWADANADQDEATKLAALREYIYDLAVSWNGNENITASWLNKKLAKLGMTDRIATDNRYALTVEVSGTLEVGVYGATRVEALEKLAALLDGNRNDRVSKLVATADPVFTDGPEDADPSVVDPAAPTTVDGTLVMLREIIMLGHISGPRYCENGANSVLRSFGLAEIPPLKSFKVTRPVEAVVSTTVKAYDEETAQRVAGWRWENGRTGYTMAAGKDTDVPTVTPVS